MKRFAILGTLVALFCVTALAQKGMRFIPQGTVSTPQTTLKCIDRKGQPTNNVTRRAEGDVLVTPPATATVETWYTIAGAQYVNFQGGQQQQFTPSVKVVFDGSDIYIQGLGYWFNEGWVKGTISGTTVTVPYGQYIGEDQYGAEYICGAQDQNTMTDIAFNYDAEEGTLVCTTPYILENSSPTVINPYAYWILPTFSKTAPEGPKPVVAPEGLVTSEWAISAMDNFGNPVSAYVNIGFDGNDVYIQGFTHYLPEAWIKGTLSEDGKTITFEGYQYFGPYNADAYTHYEFYLMEDGFTLNYDAEAGKMTGTGEIFVREAVRTYKGDVYNNPVITKVVEKAGTPAIPNIAQIYPATTGPIVQFTIPTVDTEGNAMASSKISFKWLKDIEQEVSTISFDPADYPALQESMTVFPYGFTDNEYIFYNNAYLRQEDYNNWNKIGLQVIYTGGGEEHESEIFWFTIKPYAKAIFNFNAMTDEPCSTDNSTDGDITENRTLTAGEVTPIKLTITPNTSGTANRFWETNDGPQLRVYGGTLIFEAPIGKVINKIVFNKAKWDANNSADTGSFTGSTWTGEAKKVVVTIAGNSRINSIEVYPADYVPTAVVAPENLATDTYILTATSVKPYYDPEDLTLWVKAGFDGNDAYIQGLASDYNSSAKNLWVKATKNAEGKYVIPANQFMGSASFGRYSISCYFTAIDADNNMVDAVLDFDAEQGTFTSTQSLVINNSLTELNPQQTLTNVVLTKFNEVAATPADPTLDILEFQEYSHYISCSIPTVDVNGETLNPGKLFYTVWIEKDGEQTPYVFSAPMYYGYDDPVSELPYTTNYSTWDGSHTIYFYEEDIVYPTWSKVGIQTIYYGAGECNKSNIAWSDNPLASGINNIQNDANTGKAAIFNLSGQRLSTPQKGLNIINGRKVVIK